MVNEENSDMVNRSYQVPLNIIELLRTKPNEEVAINLVKNPVINYTYLKRLKHNIESNQFQTDWTPVLKWINDVLGRDRGMIDNQKRTPMEIGVENKFRKTHFKNDTLTPLSGKQHIKITESQYKLIENILKEQNPTECQTDNAIYGIWIEPKRVAVNVDLPFVLKLDKEEHETLKANLHNAMELVLSKYFYGRETEN